MKLNSSLFLRLFIMHSQMTNTGVGSEQTLHVCCYCANYAFRTDLHIIVINKTHLYPVNCLVKGKQLGYSLYF